MSGDTETGPGVRAQYARAEALRESISVRYGDEAYADLIGPFTRPLLDAGWAPDDVWLWFGAPTGWLDGRVPADVITADPAAVREAVTQVAQGLPG